jgi:hypothetical protein
LSVAGVHRRAYRRAVYGTAAAVGVGSYYGRYGYPSSGYGSYYASAGYPGYSYGSYGYLSSGYGSYYAYGGYYRPGYRAARRVAIHRARWH